MVVQTIPLALQSDRSPIEEGRSLRDYHFYLFLAGVTVLLSCNFSTTGRQRMEHNTHSLPMSLTPMLEFLDVPRVSGEA